METKFNFSDEESNVNLKNQSISKNAKGLFFSLFSFLKEVLDFRKDTDKEATLISIKDDISIKGSTAWILICSIFVASVGLNANSLNVIYNLADFINKIAFCLVIWAAAVSGGRGK